MKNRVLKDMGATLLLLACAQFAFAQFRVTGLVTDSLSGQALPNATIREAGRNAGVHTDANGNYAISISSPMPRWKSVLSATARRTFRLTAGP